MKIKVTEEDIKHGKPCNTWDCPVSRAFLREFPEALSVQTGLAHSKVVHNPSKRNRTYELPIEATRFIQRFDEGLSVEPFEFNTTEEW